MKDKSCKSLEDKTQLEELKEDNAERAWTALLEYLRRLNPYKKLKEEILLKDLGRPCCKNLEENSCWKNLQEKAVLKKAWTILLEDPGRKSYCKNLEEKILLQEPKGEHNAEGAWKILEEESPAVRN